MQESSGKQAAPRQPKGLFLRKWKMTGAFQNFLVYYCSAILQSFFSIFFQSLTLSDFIKIKYFAKIDKRLQAKENC